MSAPRALGAPEERLGIRWHGRGGQGAFTAARLLGAAAVCAGQFALAFPSFGPERRGAPVLAFTRLDKGRIGDRSALRVCDFAVVLDETLVDGQVAAGIRRGGALLINSSRPASTWAALGPRVLTVDGTAIALEILKRPLVNAALLGALLAAADLVPIDSAVQAIETEMRPQLAALNVQVLRCAHHQVQEQLRA